MFDHAKVVFATEAQVATAAPSLPLPLRPYADALVLPPLVQPTPHDGGAWLSVWMHAAQAQLHSELATPTPIWTYRLSETPPDRLQANLATCNWTYMCTDLGKTSVPLTAYNRRKEVIPGARSPLVSCHTYCKYASRGIRRGLIIVPSNQPQLDVNRPHIEEAPVADGCE